MRHKLSDLETFAAYNRLLDMSAGIIDDKNFYEAAKDFVDAYEKHESTAETSVELPENDEVYRDVFGNKYSVIAVMPEGVFGKNPTVVLRADSGREIFTLPLDEFLNPTFTKVD